MPNNKTASAKLNLDHAQQIIALSGIKNHLLQTVIGLLSDDVFSKEDAANEITSAIEELQEQENICLSQWSQIKNAPTTANSESA
jgi:hypothetical protein